MLRNFKVFAGPPLAAGRLFPDQIGRHLQSAFAAAAMVDRAEALPEKPVAALGGLIPGEQRGATKRHIPVWRFIIKMESGGREGWR